MQVRPGSSPLVTAQDWAHLARAHVAFGVGLWDKSWRMGFGYVRRAASEAAGIGLHPERSGDLLGTFLFSLRNYCGEMATVLPVALDGLSRDLDRHVKGEPSDVLNPIGVAPPLPRTYVVDGVPVVLPVRIVDASQGLAIWMVSAAKAQDHLAKITEKFTVVDVGDGRTALTILGCDYRETDLGVYREIGVALFVRPRDDPAEMPGNIFLSLSVNDKFNLIRASALWGYTKTLAPNLLVNYSTDTTDFAVDRNDPAALSISFPRFGSARATDIPIYTYGLGKNAAGKREIPLKTLISRSAAGQGEQVAGNVALQLGDPAQPGCCVCRLWPPEINQACVCLILRDLGLPRPPDANGWLEHMSADCSAAMVCK